MRYLLTKSRYIRAMQCCKALYLDVYRREVARLTLEQRQAFQHGRDFEQTFKATFPQAIDTMERARHSPDASVLITRDLLTGNGAVTLLEAGFAYHHTLVLTDVLHRDAAGHICMYEVKSNPQRKPIFREDLYVQYYVVYHALGARELQAYLVLPETEDGVSPFRVVDLTAEAYEAMPTVAKRIEQYVEVLHGLEPQVAMGEHCNAPYSCPYKDYCSGRLLVQQEIFTLEDNPPL